MLDELKKIKEQLEKLTCDLEDKVTVMKEQFDSLELLLSTMDDAIFIAEEASDD